MRVSTPARAGRLNRPRPSRDAERLAYLQARLRSTQVDFARFLHRHPELAPTLDPQDLPGTRSVIPPFAWHEAETVIAGDLEADPSHLFTTLDTTPVAVGPLTQTYRATVPNAGAVLIKVQRPGVRRRVMRDLRRLEFAARVLAMEAMRNRTGPAELVRQFRADVVRELDLVAELGVLQRLHDQHRGWTPIQIPRPHRELSGPRVLTTQDIGGAPLLTLLAQTPRDATTHRQLAQNLLEAALVQSLRPGLVQTDFDPGNVIVAAGGRISFAGFGLCEELRPMIASRHARYLEEVCRIEPDPRRLYLALTSVLDADGGADRSDLREDFQREFRIWAQAPGEDPYRDPLAPEPPAVGPWMLAGMRIAARNGFDWRPGALGAQRALLGAQQAARHLDPDADLGTTAREHLRARTFHERLSPPDRTELRTIGASVLDLARDAPEQLHRILVESSEGQLELPVDVSPKRPLRRRRGSRLLTSVLLLVGLSAAVSRAQMPRPAAVWRCLGRGAGRRPSAVRRRHLPQGARMSLTLGERECHVWWASTARRDEDRLVSVLSDSELERRHGYVRTADRGRFTVGAALVRLALAGYLGTAPERLTVDRRCGRCGAQHGKTRLTSDSGIDLSVSHSGGRVVVAVARGLRIGIDVERVRTDIDVDRLAGSVLSGLEHSTLSRLDPPARASAFLQRWTGKEATLKALGTGIQGPLDEVADSVAEVHELRCEPGYVASLGVIGGSVRVRSFTAEPLLLAAGSRPCG